MGTIEATITQLRCESCRFTSADVRFVGDTDMVTNGLATASSSKNMEVAVGRLATDDVGKGFDAAMEDFASRVSSETGGDFRAVPIVGERGGFKPVGVAFQEFRRLYRAPEIIYRCPRCGGEAVVTREMSPAQFEAEGGMIRSFDEVLIL